MKRETFIPLFTQKSWVELYCWHWDVNSNNIYSVEDKLYEVRGSDNSE